MKVGVRSPLGCAAYNQHWGIALNGSTNIAFGGDRIFGNHLTAIGLGLTLGVSQALFLDSATFDPATGLTTIRGHVPPPPASAPGGISLYASSGLGLAGFGEAEVPIGSTGVQKDSTFVFKVQRDLRDTYITATGSVATTRTGGFTFDTYTQSFGLSNAVHVDR